MNMRMALVAQVSHCYVQVAHEAERNAHQRVLSRVRWHDQIVGYLVSIRDTSWVVGEGKTSRAAHPGEHWSRRVTRPYGL